MQAEQIKNKSDRFIKQIEDKGRRKLAELEKREILENYEGDDELTSFVDTFNFVKKAPKRAVYPTGHALLDEYLDGGLKVGELVLVSGYTNNGKTSFCYDLTRRMSSINIFWIPFEESAEELAEKCDRYNQKPIPFFHPKKIVREDVEWIEERILEAKLKQNCKIVFIDNLHFMTMSDKNDFAKTGLLCKQLKQIAEKIGVCIVLIAHLRKSHEGMDKMPTLEDISGDSDASKIANKIISVWQEQTKELGTKKVKYTGVTYIITQKIRSAFGKKGAIPFSWERGVYTEKTLEDETKRYNDKTSF